MKKQEKLNNTSINNRIIYIQLTRIRKITEEAVYNQNERWDIIYPTSYQTEE